MLCAYVCIYISIINNKLLIDANANNHYKTDKTFQNDIVQKKQTGKRKRNSIVRETEDLSEQLEEAK